MQIEQSEVYERYESQNLAGVSLDQTLGSDEFVIFWRVLKNISRKKFPPGLQTYH